MYQKEIIYMGLFHNDVKERNAGYLKVDKREGVYRLELQVKNIPGSITGNFPIRLQSETGWQETDGLILKEGNGKWNGNIAEPVLRAEIHLSDDEKIKGESRLVKTEEVMEKKAERKDAAEPPAQPERQQEGPREAVEVKIPIEPKVPTEMKVPTEPKVPTEMKVPTEPEMEAEKAPAMRIESMSSRQANKPIIKAERISVKPEHTPLYENKWEQLLTTYEQIHPYGDNRIYIKLAPKDFIILRENYQHLVNNSFLLHGFYNYRYLILGKEKDFYLGVPGVFYEREKMVALMFGFEAFECEGGGAEEGKFGYYLRKVEL